MPIFQSRLSGAADTFPKSLMSLVQMEFGEMLIVPRVSDEGALNYEFDFH